MGYDFHVFRIRFDWLMRGFAERFGIWLREASTRDQGLVGILA